MVKNEKKTFIIFIVFFMFYTGCQSNRVQDPGSGIIDVAESIGKLEAEQSESRATSERLEERAAEFRARSEDLAATIAESNRYIGEIEDILERIRNTAGEGDPGDKGRFTDTELSKKTINNNSGN